MTRYLKTALLRSQILSEADHRAIAKRDPWLPEDLDTINERIRAEYAWRKTAEGQAHLSAQKALTEKHERELEQKEWDELTLHFLSRLSQ